MNITHNFKISDVQTHIFRRLHPAERLPAKPGVFALMCMIVGEHIILYVGYINDLSLLELKNICRIPEYIEACELGRPAILYSAFSHGKSQRAKQAANAIKSIYDPPLNRR